MSETGDPNALFHTTYKPAGYQKCPICEGSGKLQDSENMINHHDCHVCNGHGIIHRVSGKPPKDN